MSEYRRYQVNSSIDTLEEIVDDLKFMVTKDLEEDKKMLLEGWKSSSIGKVINICDSCQEQLFEASRDLERIIEDLKKIY